MAKTTGTRIGILALFLLLLLACDKNSLSPKFPLEPEIEFYNFEQSSGDFDVLTISFTDGDGDIGLDDYQTAPPFDTSSKYYHNLFLDYYGKVGDGEWTKIEPLVPFYYRTPNITPESQQKSIQGKISVDLYKPYDPTSDSIKFMVTLADRALNESNTIETPAFLNPSKI